MFPEERQRLILRRLTAQGHVRVNELARELGVSAVTIRQDLGALAEQGLVRRTHGGAVAVQTGFELPFARTAAVNASEKARLAEAAAAMVGEGETIVLDVGTTTTAIANALLGRRRLTVVTNALNIAMILEESPGITVIVTGGTLRAIQHSLVNPLGTELLRLIRADRAFIGANGVETEAGVTNANFPEAEIKRAMMAAARERIVVADHTQIGRVAAAVVAPVTSFDLLLTTSEADPAEIEKLRQKGLAVRLV
ncbi:MAG: DeoR/GlpR transcriptional regulator [Firmicutes bacterium]|nr:DeoR/GlpR transcriptional regulator [Bacillota bacterium]